MNFTELGLREDLDNVCVKVGWERPTDIQKSSIPVALTGVDLIGLAETGGGKTGAFLLPILNDWLNSEKPVMFGLVLTPTRELAAQIENQFILLGSEFGIKTTLLTGADDMSDQMVELGKWNSHIVIATPGRIVALLAKSKPARTMLETIKKLVIDEADRMLQLEFESDMEAIAKVLPSRNSLTNQTKLNKGKISCVRQTQLFSATFSQRIDKVASYLLYRPEKVFVDNRLQIPKQLKQMILVLKYVDRVPALFGLLRQYLARKKPVDQSDEVDENPREIKSAMVFVTTCKQTKPLEIYLNKMGASAVALHSQLSQNQRDKSINDFRNGQANIMIATDIASRGIDIDHVRLIVNLDLPQNPDWYKHRVGRTARAGREGLAVTFVTEMNRVEYEGMEKRLGLEKLPVHPAIKLTEKDRVRSDLCIREARKEERLKEKQLEGRDTEFTQMSTNFGTKRQKLNQKEMRKNKK